MSMTAGEHFEVQGGIDIEETKIARVRYASNTFLSTGLTIYFAPVLSAKQDFFLDITLPIQEFNR